MTVTPHLAGQFGTDFAAFELVGSFSGDAWQKALGTQAVTDIWLREPHTLFIYDVDDRRYWLFLDKSVEWTFALRFEVHENLQPKEMQVSVEDRSSLSAFVTLDDLSVYPQGSFVDRATASAAIVDFLKNPTQPPSSVQWIDEEALDWPEFD